jgi:hypothetical protein
VVLAEPSSDSSRLRHLIISLRHETGGHEADVPSNTPRRIPHPIAEPNADLGPAVC